MNKMYQRWARRFLAALLAALALCGGIVYAVDPCLYYRMPEDRLPVFFNERYQAAGIIRQSPADTVLLGSSMVSNYRASWIEEFYRCSGLRVTIPDGYFFEFDQVLDLLFREHSPDRILFALDLNALVRNERDASRAMPDYLYNQNPLDDIKYLLNKDCLYYSFYTLLNSYWGAGQTLDEGFTWDSTSSWGQYAALQFYDRAPATGIQMPEDAYLQFAQENLAVMANWFQKHPDTKFEIFLSPYSILAWDKSIRQGDLDARLAAVKLACKTLWAYPNVRVHAPLFAKNMVTELNNYCDYVHHSGEAGKWVLGNVCAEKFLLREEDVEKTLADWREFVVHYDYDALWDGEFWERWYEDHDQPPDWCKS
nr:hypothetical protein [uncultured Oscillibacter sp.]